MLKQRLKFFLESGIGLGRPIFFLQVEDQGHQRLGDEASAENAKPAMFVGAGSVGIGIGSRCCGHG